METISTKHPQLESGIGLSDFKMYAFNHDIKFVLHILLNLDRISLFEKTTKYSACTIF